MDQSVFRVGHVDAFECFPLLDALSRPSWTHMILALPRLGCLETTHLLARLPKFHVWLTVQFVNADFNVYPFQDDLKM